MPYFILNSSLFQLSKNRKKKERKKDTVRGRKHRARGSIRLMHAAQLLRSPSLSCGALHLHPPPVSPPDGSRVHSLPQTLRRALRQIPFASVLLRIGVPAEILPRQGLG